MAYKSFLHQRNVTSCHDILLDLYRSATLKLKTKIEIILFLLLFTPCNSDNIILLKGHIKPSADWRAVDSPQKWTNQFFFALQSGNTWNLKSKFKKFQVFPDCHGKKTLFFSFYLKYYCISKLFCFVNSCQIKGLTLAVVMVWLSVE